VSTVKAGNTASVLGATRRLAEIAALSCVTDSFAVRVIRLGNVLGSRGGILARFREQALANAPITVTDPEAARFVLAADEAASAVLLAAGPLSADLPRDAVLFPEHGGQVRIAEIAAAVARWAEARHGRRTEVRVVGLRPGEALRDPEPGALAPAGAWLSWFVPPEKVDAIDARVHEIERAASAGDDTRVRELLAAALPALGAPPANVIVLRR
jgi:FlaA1/EpsC-like NDP-sugar epimerase